MTLKQNKEASEQILENEELAEKKLTCGIIMPIATMSPEYTAEHWEDIRVIIDAAVEKAGFEPRIVSDSEDSTIIHKSIINNLYNDEIVVCDVSNKNANVMFELGMRLAFNKPVVIIKDDKTGYSFDTSNIQHLAYRKDLRHNTVQKFIDDLAIKIKATHEAPKKEGHQTFLSHFGKFEVAKIENKPIEGGEALEKILSEISVIKSQLNQTKPNLINSDMKRSDNIYYDTSKMEINLIFKDLDKKNIEIIMKKIYEEIPMIKNMYYDDNNTLLIKLDAPSTVLSQRRYQNMINEIINKYRE